jgi:hypothetical protein
VAIVWLQSGEHPCTGQALLLQQESVAFTQVRKSEVYLKTFLYIFLTSRAIITKAPFFWQRVKKTMHW